MSSLSDVVEAVKVMNKTVEDTGLFVADYITDELRKTTDALKGVGGNEPVGFDSSMLTSLGQQIYDAIIFQTDYLDDTLQKIGANIAKSLEKSASIQEMANEDNSGREIKPLTPESVEQATVEANKSFFGADFGKSFLGFAEKVSSGAGKVVGRVKDVALKPIVGAWDKIKEVFARMAEVFLAVGFMKFMQGWEKASKFFGENANFGEKLASGIANIIGSLLGFTENETKALAENIATSFDAISEWFKKSIMVMFEGVIDIFKGLVQGEGSLVWDGVKKIIGGVFEGLMGISEMVLNLFFSKETTDSILGTVRRIVTAVPEFFASVWDGMKSAISKTIEWLNSTVIKYLPKVPYIKDPFAGGSGGSSAEAAATATPAAATGAAATPATPMKTQGSNEAGKVAEQSKSNAAAKETATTPAVASNNNSVVTQVNNNANNKTVYGMKFDTKPGIGNSNWAISHAMP